MKYVQYILMVFCISNTLHTMENGHTAETSSTESEESPTITPSSPPSLANTLACCANYLYYATTSLQNIDVKLRVQMETEQNDRENAYRRFFKDKKEINKKFDVMFQAMQEENNKTHQLLRKLIKQISERTKCKKPKMHHVSKKTSHRLKERGSKKDAPATLSAPSSSAD